MWSHSMYCTCDMFGAAVLVLNLWHMAKVDAFCSLPRPCEALEPSNGLPIRGMDLIFMQCLEAANRRSENWRARKWMVCKAKRSGQK